MGDLEVTIPRVVIFRDAIVDLLQVEMGALFNKKAREGFSTFLNYVGGSYIYIRLKFTDRLKILASSWATANNKKLDEMGGLADGGAEEAGGEEGAEKKEGQDAQASADVEQQVVA